MGERRINLFVVALHLGTLALWVACGAWFNARMGKHWFSLAGFLISTAILVFHAARTVVRLRGWWRQ